MRLRSGSIGLFTVDITAPVRHGTVTIDASGVRVDLVLALEKVSTGNFLMDRAARSLVSRHDAHDLSYRATGPASAQPWEVTGNAVSGDIDVLLALTLTPVGAAHPMDELELVHRVRCPHGGEGKREQDVDVAGHRVAGDLPGLGTSGPGCPVAQVVGVMPRHEGPRRPVHQEVAGRHLLQGQDEVDAHAGRIYGHCPVANRGRDVDGEQADGAAAQAHVGTIDSVDVPRAVIDQGIRK